MSPKSSQPATTYGRYQVRNTSTKYILYHSDDMSKAKHVYHCVPRRKHGDIILYDGETGKVLKLKLSKSLPF